jgi:hypothetical protein
LLPRAAAFQPLFVAGAIDENPPHGLGCGGEKMPSRVPPLNLIGVDQPDVRFMHQRRCLQGLPRILLGHF